MNPFEISVDPSRRRLDLSLRGFWDHATFDAFAVEFVRALQQARRHGGLETALVDGRDFAVQSKEILARFTAIMQENAPLLAKRTATIVPSELNRMQSARVGEAIARRDFDSREEAEDWLAEASGDVRAA